MPRRRRPRRRPQPRPKAKQKAAEQAAKERARAAKRAAQLAAATQRARTSWDSHARPEKLAIVRTPDRRPGDQRKPDPAGAAPAGHHDHVRAGPVPAEQLADHRERHCPAVGRGRAVPRAWPWRSAATSRRSGWPVGPKPSDAASIYTGSGKLRVHDVAISSYDPRSGQPLPIGPGRPFIVVSSNGQMNAVDATFSDLGTPIEPDDRPGVLFGINSSGSMVRTTLLRNSTGLKLDRSNAIRLDAVTVTESAADGLVLRGDKATNAGRHQGRAQRRQRRAGRRREHRPGRSPGSPPPATVASGWWWPSRRSRGSMASSASATAPAACG